jgi:hypothetical protein
MIRPSLWLLLAAALLLGPAVQAQGKARPAPSARAAQDATTAARGHFERGARLYKQARYKDAIAAFEAAYKLKPHGAILFNIAQCHEKLGDLASAWKGYDAYLRATPDAEDEQNVRVAMGNLRRRLAEAGVQRLEVVSTPSGATVLVDGKAVGQTPFKGNITQGPHRIGVEKRGYRLDEREVFMTQDAPVALEFALLRPSDAPLVEAEPAAGKLAHGLGRRASGGDSTAGVTASPRSPSSARTWVWVGAGVTAAALATAAAFGLSAKATSATLRDGTVRDQQTATDLRDGAQRRATTANVLFGTAGVLGAATAAVFFLEGEF